MQQSIKKELNNTLTLLKLLLHSEVQIQEGKITKQNDVFKMIEEKYFNKSDSTK